MQIFSHFCYFSKIFTFRWYFAPSPFIHHTNIPTMLSIHSTKEHLHLSNAWIWMNFANEWISFDLNFCSSFEKAFANGKNNFLHKKMEKKNGFYFFFFFLSSNNFLVHRIFLGKWKSAKWGEFSLYFDEDADVSSFFFLTSSRSLNPSASQSVSQPTSKLRRRTMSSSSSSSFSALLLKLLLTMILFSFSTFLDEFCYK